MCAPRDQKISHTSKRNNDSYTVWFVTTITLGIFLLVVLNELAAYQNECKRTLREQYIECNATFDHLHESVNIFVRDTDTLIERHISALDRCHVAYDSLLEINEEQAEEMAKLESDYKSIVENNTKLANQQVLAAYWWRIALNESSVEASQVRTQLEASEWWNKCLAVLCVLLACIIFFGWRFADREIAECRLMDWKLSASDSGREIKHVGNTSPADSNYIRDCRTRANERKAERHHMKAIFTILKARSTKLHARSLRCKLDAAMQASCTKQD